MRWSVSNGWKFTGTPTTFNFRNGVGTITGSGTLQYFSHPKLLKDGRWAKAASGNVNFTVKYTRHINSNGSLGRVETFAIGFTGTPISGIQLPVLGDLVKVKSSDN